MFDPEASPSPAALTNCSLCIIRPHALQKGVVGGIVKAILGASFEISALKVTRKKKGAGRAPPRTQPVRGRRRGFA